jgi:phage major head subunit gpT-like protein
MLINAPGLDALRTTFGTQYQAGYSSTQIWHDKICTEIPSNSKSNTYGWVAQMLVLREWLGPRVALNLSEHAYTLVNKSFEGTVEVDRDDIEDDNLGIYSSVMMPQLGEATRKHPGILAKALLQANTALAFDGLSLFNDAHLTYDKTGVTPTYDNNFTLALDGNNFNTVWSTMASYVGEDGQPLGVMPNLLIVPPQLKLAALTIMNGSLYSPITGQPGANAIAIENPLKGWAEVLVVPELANDPTAWYLADTSKAIKPLVWQNRRAPNFVSRDNPADPKVFDLKKFTYGVDYRGNVGITLPFLIAKSKP